MAGYAFPIKRLISELGKLPGVGEKTATRLAMHLLRAPEGDARGLAESILEVRDKIRFCQVCYNFAEAELCNVCRDAARDAGVICVVEDPDALMAIEDSGGYSGTYHVLHGVLSPLDGIGPDQLKLRELVDRIREKAVREVILATNPSVSGESTALLISRMRLPRRRSGNCSRTAAILAISTARLPTWPVRRRQPESTCPSSSLLPPNQPKP